MEMDDLDKKLDELFEKKAAQLREQAEQEKKNKIEYERVKSLVGEFLRSKVNPALEEVKSKFEKRGMPVTLDLDDPLADPPKGYFPFANAITIGKKPQEYSYAIYTDRIRGGYSIRALMSFKDPKTNKFETKNRTLPQPDIISKDEIVQDVVKGYIEVNS